MEAVSPQQTLHTFTLQPLGPTSPLHSQAYDLGWVQRTLLWECHTHLVLHGFRGMPLGLTRMRTRHLPT